MANITSLPQVFSPFVSFIVGDRELGTYNLVDRSPNTFVSLDLVKNTDSMAGFSATIKLNYLSMPDLYDYVVELFKQNQSGLVPCTLMYGYIDGPRTPVYDMEIISVEPTDMWMNLTFKLTTGNSRKEMYNFNQEFIRAYEVEPIYNLSDLVRMIATYQGWSVGEIVDTKPQSSFSDGTPEPVTLLNYTMTPLEAIQNLLQRFPNESLAGEGGYISLFKNTPTGQKYYFVPSSYTFNQYSSQDLKTYDFYFNALPQSQVISFEPKLSTAVTKSAVASQQITSEKPSIGMISSDTNELVNLIYGFTADDNLNSSLSQELYNGSNLKMQKVGMVSYDGMKNYLASSIKNDINAYVDVIGIKTTATLELIGDPDINPQDYINIVPLYPASWDVPMKIHPSGGTYWVTKVTDSIDSSGYTTTLEAVTDGNYKFKLGEITTESNADYKSKGGNQ